MPRHAINTVTADLSEVGKTNLYIEAEIEYEHDRGCRQTYDSPAEPEWGYVQSVRTLSVCGSDWEITRETRPDWMDYADACAAKRLEDANALRFTRDYEC